MARIRSIHPGLFTDEEFMQLTVSSPLAVPLLLGLWGEADDQGLFEWKPLTIKARILPAVPADIGPLLEALVDGQFIRRFEVDGRSYGAIRNFRRWQRPEKPKALHPLPGDLRSYVGLVADQSPADAAPQPPKPPRRAVVEAPPSPTPPRSGDTVSPTSRRPVADQSPKSSAEVGGRMEEVGDNLEKNTSIQPRPPATERDPPAGAPAVAHPGVAVVAAFDQAGREAYGEEAWNGHRPWPDQRDLGTATAMLDASGSADVLRPVFDALLRGMAQRGRAPPRTLAYARNAVADALAAQNQPLETANVQPHRGQASPESASPRARMLAGFAQAVDDLGGATDRDPAA